MVCPHTRSKRTNHLAHQRHAAFTTACFALPSGTAPRNRTSHQGRANRNGTATTRTSPQIIPLTSDTPRLRQPVSRSPVACRHANTLPTKAAQIPMALQHNERNFATHGCPYATSVSHDLQKSCERFVRDFQVTRQVSKTSVSYETSSKTHMSKSAKRAFRTRLPPKVKRKHPSEHTHHAALPSSFAIPAPPNHTRSHSNPNVTVTLIHLYHNSQPHDSLRLPRIFPRPHV